MLNDYGKLILLMVAMVGGFALAITGMILGQPEAFAGGTGLVGTVVGYITGNGVLARRGEAPSPVLVPTPERLERLERASSLAEATDALRRARAGGAP